MKQTFLFFYIIGTIFTFNIEVRGETFDIDPQHSNVEFEIDHLFSRIRGRFSDFKGVIIFDSKSKELKSGQMSISATSINTLVEKRDNHLRSKDFFEVEKHKEITFMSKSVKRKGGSWYSVMGDLTIHGVTRSVELAVTYRGKASDPWKHERASFTLRGQINRQDFGVSWNQTVENNILLVGNKVDLFINVSAIKRK